MGEKKGAMFVSLCVSWEAAKDEKKEGKKIQREIESKKEVKMKSGGDRNHSQDGMMRCCFECMFTGIKPAIGSQSIPSGCVYHIRYAL